MTPHAEAAGPAVLTRPSRRRRLGIAAVAAALLVLGAGCGSGAARSPQAVEPTPVADTAGRWWATWHDVTVQVPTSWTWEAPTARPDCVRPGEKSGWSKDVPDHPYVAVDTTLMPVATVGCVPAGSDVPAEFGVLPFEDWQPHVAFADPHRTDARPDGTWVYRGWTLERRVVGDVQVAVLVKPRDDPARILGTARVLGLDEEDAEGCPPSDPVQSVGVVQPPASSRRPDGTTRMTSVSVCQYTRTAGERAGLIGSRRLTGADARGLLEGIDAAPAGGGPDEPADCAGTGDTAILLRTHLDNGDHQDAYVYYDSCTDNGVYTPDGTKQLTVGDCRPLFAVYPIALWSGWEQAFLRCSSD